MEDTVSVTMSREDFNFLKNLTHEMNTQDRRATADPYYYTIRYQRETLAPQGRGERDAYFDFEEGATEFESEAEAEAHFKKEGIGGLELTDRVESLELCGVNKYYETSNVFLTEKACHRHLNGNKHRYPGGAYSYVDHAFRNPEMERLITIVKKIGGQV